jgi:hypothetical protein
MVIFAMAIMLFVGATATPVMATEITNTSIPTPPGVTFGMGNANVGFTSDVEALQGGTLTLSLSVIDRYLGPATESGANYYVPTGATTVAGKTGSAWGIDYDVNTQSAGVGTATTASYTYTFMLYNVDTGLTATFDPSNALLGNSLNGNTDFQNSEAPSFAFIGPPMAYDVNATGEYIATLTAYFAGTTNIAGQVQVDIFANPGGTATPEPGTLAMLGSGLLVVGFTGRKKLVRS